MIFQEVWEPWYLTGRISHPLITYHRNQMPYYQNKIKINVYYKCKKDNVIAWSIYPKHSQGTPDSSPLRANYGDYMRPQNIMLYGAILTVWLFKLDRLLRRSAREMYVRSSAFETSQNLEKRRLILYWK